MDTSARGFARTLAGPPVHTPPQRGDAGCGPVRAHRARETEVRTKPCLMGAVAIDKKRRAEAFLQSDFVRVPFEELHAVELCENQRFLQVSGASFCRFIRSRIIKLCSAILNNNFFNLKFPGTLQNMSYTYSIQSA